MYSLKHTKRGASFFCADDVWLRNKLSLKLSACARVCLYSNKNFKLRVMRSIDRRIFLPTLENVSLILSLSLSTYSLLHNRVDGDDGWLSSALFFFALKKVGFFAARSR